MIQFLAAALLCLTPNDPSLDNGPELSRLSVIPAGVYYVSSPIQLDHSWTGDGVELRFTESAVATRGPPACVYIANQSDIEISGITFTGASGKVPWGQPWGVLLTARNCERLVIRDCTFSNWVSALHIQGCRECDVHHNSIFNLTRGGVVIWGLRGHACHDIRIRLNDIWETGDDAIGVGSNPEGPFPLSARPYAIEIVGNRCISRLTPTPNGYLPPPRTIAIFGAVDVTIRDNFVANASMTGVLVSCRPSDRTVPSELVTVENNTIAGRGAFGPITPGQPANGPFTFHRSRGRWSGNVEVSRKAAAKRDWPMWSE